MGHDRRYRTGSDLVEPAAKHSINVRRTRIRVALHVDVRVPVAVYVYPYEYFCSHNRRVY
eukprot:scaffold558654_cov19-Prasinocladus_malaysianus.AAC.1